MFEPIHGKKILYIFIDSGSTQNFIDPEINVDPSISRVHVHNTFELLIVPKKHTMHRLGSNLLDVYVWNIGMNEHMNVLKEEESRVFPSIISKGLLLSCRTHNASRLLSKFNVKNVSTKFFWEGLLWNIIERLNSLKCVFLSANLFWWRVYVQEMNGWIQSFKCKRNMVPVNSPSLSHWKVLILRLFGFQKTVGTWCNWRESSTWLQWVELPVVRVIFN